MIDLFIVHGYEWLCTIAACDSLNVSFHLHSLIIQQNNWHLSWWKETDRLSVWFYVFHLLSTRKRKGRHVSGNHTDVTLHLVDVCYLGYNAMMCTKQVLCHTVCITQIKSVTLKA